MLDRTFLARRKAMKEVDKIADEKANEKVLKEVPKKDVKKKEWEDVPIQKLNIEDESLVKEFESFYKVIEEEGLNPPNLIGALKKGNKYKGFYWRIA